MFKGIQNISLVDYPAKIATTVFTGGCNFRCDWCHNKTIAFPELVLNQPDINIEDIQSTILERKEFIDGVCITGGEPTLWGEELFEFIQWVKEKNLLLKLDTNGYKPDVLESYLDRKVVDFVAMDIKNSFDKYAKTVGLDSVDLSKIEKSIKIIKEKAPLYQFRITKVPHLVEDSDIQWIEKKFNVKLSVQKYRPV